MIQPENSLEKGMPASIDAERSILGAALLDNAAYSEAAERITDDDFALDSHQRLFARMGDLSRAGKAIDIVTLSEELGRRKEVESVGGIAYIFSLTEGLPRRISIVEYVNIVAAKSLARKAIKALSLSISELHDQSDIPDDVVTRCIRDLESAMAAKASDSDMEAVGQYIETHDPMEERPLGLQTGFKKFDEITCGLYRKEMTLIAARTSMGKTAMAGSLTINIARRGQPVAVFINEQSKRSFLARMICGRSGVSLEKYKKNDLSHVERHYISEAANEIKMLPIFWEDKSSMTVRAMRNRVRRLQRTEDIAEVIIDQLSHVSAEGLVEKNAQRDQIVGAKAVAIKQMIAQDLDIPVTVFHQLNRDTLKNKDSRPTLGNLADSGVLEQAADLVAFLHRPEYYERGDAALKGKGEIIIAKNRDGPTGICECRYAAEICLWSDN